MALKSTRGQTALPRRFDPFFAILERIEHGSVEVGLPDGRVFLAEGEAPGPAGRFDVVNPEMFARLIREGELGFAEMFIDGWWTTPDLQPLLDVLLLNNRAIGRNFTGMGLVRAYERLRHQLRGNSRRGAKRNISAHYDLGNAFYAAWLDRSMTYSSALFAPGRDDLTDAQRNKYAAICDRMQLAPDHEVLEIGCGWGGFAEYAIAERGARVTGLTLSREQADFARARLFEAGLAERAEIRLQDYRDERGRYDGVASIEMFEAVGEKYWPTFFGTLRERLKPGSLAAMQVITIADDLFAGYRKGTDFIQKFIFPGGMLPSPQIFRAEVERSGLDLIGSMEFGKDYSRTLREWRERFNGAWQDIAALGFDGRFRRMWNFYLASCAACFAAGTTDVSQVALRRGT
ncbi:cyclopropane-fatty-acyl-phospholipid synthase family protein [Paralimibaculum aggregatum]|uniref:Cyclopropane-fatty-acyl-phospholipid synthase family protein n=1 Tax=Paralimibaculum aggregatum TaxID=3036245 RepID=A0ABQ6LS81_9RHOB|nr:cyclopropane-fatty-acyl-phospholipid synthase family protein [Limibaculum sp. NKW23]GMG84726.1 cyclopropane-fatty-acyl-phospholipid synthase family protein [Limibaculum sp. NKW23]